MTQYLKVKQAAEYLQLSKPFLDRARMTGTGPKFVKLSGTAVRYRREDLDAWMQSRLVTSTAEAASRILGTPMYGSEDEVVAPFQEDR